jgi:hypothetical protein
LKKRPVDSPSAPYRSAERRLRTAIFRPYRKTLHLPTFFLTMWDTYERDSLGKNRIAYVLTQTNPGKPSRVLFDGADYCCAPGHSIDGNQCLVALMGFLCLRPGDTDAEYFVNYTPEQKEFCEQHAETLGAEVQARYCDENGRVKTQR